MPKRARFLSEPPPKPPPNFGFPLHLRHVQIHLHRLLRAAQIVANLDGTANKNLSKCLAQKYPNSFSQNTEERRALRYFFDESN